MQTIAREKTYNISSNTREMVISSIDARIAGANGWGFASEELVYNSRDARSAHILVQFKDNPDGTMTVIVSDQGHGFRSADLLSVLSHFMSSKSRDDDSTFGVNGTGIKHSLGLGDYSKTRVRIESIAEDNPNVLKTAWFDIDYLVRVHQVTAILQDNPKRGKKLMKDLFLKHSQEVELPKKSYWINDKMPDRKFGSNIFLENISKDKFPSPKVFINNFAKFLTPRIIPFVKVYYNREWHDLKPVRFDGEFFTKIYTRKRIGKVAVDLFVDAKYNRGKIQLCGRENRVLELKDLLRNIDKIPQELEVLQACGGYIYIDSLNGWRAHLNTLKDTFYSDKVIVKELLDILVQVTNKVSKMLEIDKSEKDNNKELHQEQLIDRLVQATKKKFGDLNQKITDREASSGRIVKKPKSLKESDGISILPNEIYLSPGETRLEELKNEGPTSIDLSKMRWDASNAPVEVDVDPNMGHSVLITATNQDDCKGFIKLSHPDFAKSQWKIPVFVSTSPFKRIVGPKKIYGGGKYFYFIEDLSLTENGKIQWKLDIPAIGELTQDGMQTYLTCNDILKKGSKKVFLKALAKETNYCYVQKTLEYFPNHKVSDAVLFSFGDCVFELKKQSLGLNGAWAQLGSAWQSSEYPVIGIDWSSQRYEEVSRMVSERVSKMRFPKTELGNRQKQEELAMQEYEYLIAAIGAAALSHLTKTGADRNEALSIYESFLDTMRVR